MASAPRAPHPCRTDPRPARQRPRSECSSHGVPWARMPPPTRNMAAVPSTDSVFMSHGAKASMPRPTPRTAASGRRCRGAGSGTSPRRRASRWRPPGHTRRRSSAMRDADEHRDAYAESRGGDRAQRDHDDLRRQDEVGADGALDLVASRRATQVDVGIDAARRAASGDERLSSSRCTNACQIFSKPSKHRNRPPAISSGTMAQGATALIAQRRGHQDRLVDERALWPPPTPPAARDST